MARGVPIDRGKKENGLDEKNQRRGEALCGGAQSRAWVFVGLWQCPSFGRLWVFVDFKLSTYLVDKSLRRHVPT